jgi:hypothetical protein
MIIYSYTTYKDENDDELRPLYTIAIAINTKTTPSIYLLF